MSGPYLRMWWRERGCGCNRTAPYNPVCVCLDSVPRSGCVRFYESLLTFRRRICPPPHPSTNMLWLPRLSVRLAHGGTSTHREPRPVPTPFGNRRWRNKTTPPTPRASISNTNVTPLTRRIISTNATRTHISFNEHPRSRTSDTHPSPVIAAQSRAGCRVAFSPSRISPPAHQLLHDPGDASKYEGGS